MAFIWTKDLEVGNLQIDTEHKSLIEAINNLLLACNEGRGRSEIVATVNFLKNYTKEHFSHEEILQRQSKYPDYTNHKKYHEGFIQVVQRIALNLEANGPSILIVSEINQQLGSWLINHIKQEDVKVAKHLSLTK